MVAEHLQATDRAVTLTSVMFRIQREDDAELFIKACGSQLSVICGLLHTISVTGASAERSYPKAVAQGRGTSRGLASVSVWWIQKLVSETWHSRMHNSGFAGTPWHVDQVVLTG